MKGYKVIIIIQFVFILIKQNLCGVTPEQMMAAGKLMRDVCQPKFPKIPNDVLNNISNGEFPEDKDVKCYVNCILEMMQAIKKGKYSLEQSLKQVDVLLPDDYKDDFRNGFVACKGATDGIKNHCDSAYALLKCLHANIVKFAFP